MGNQSTRESLNDKKYDGKDYLADQELQNGPLLNRRVTDGIFLLIFLATIGAYGWTCAYAFEHGRPRQLLTPVDGDGRLCGYNETKGYPALYYGIRHDSFVPRAVCVDKCPLEVDSTFACKPTKHVPSASLCENEYSKSGKGHIGYGTNRVLRRFCLPDIDKLPPSVDLDAYDNLIGNFGLDDVQEYAQDIEESENIYYYAFVSCIVVTILYSILIYHATGLVVWVSIISTGCGIFLLSLSLSNYRNKHYGSGTQTAKGQELSDQNYGKALRGVCTALNVLTVVYFLAICCLYKNIAISVGVLKTSAAIIFQNMRILLMPFCSALCVLCWSSYWITGLAFLLSTGEIKQPRLGSQLKTITLDQR